MNTNAFRLVVCLLLSSCSSLPPHSSQREPNFIGGSAKAFFVPGTASFRNQDLGGSCTVTVVDPKHILLAAHCFATTAAAITGFGSPVNAVPKTGVLSILEHDGTVRKVDIKINKVSLYPQVIHGSNLGAIAGSTPDQKLGTLLETGDFAVMELDGEIAIEGDFPKVLVSRKLPQGEILVGGFGKKDKDSMNSAPNVYTGSRAVFGESINVFYLGETVRHFFKKTSEVCFELLNQGQEISYLAPGDSGGGVFLNDETGNKLVGINQSGLIADVEFLKMSDSGKVLERPDTAGGKLIGAAHVLISSNKSLVKWIKTVLPSTSYIIE